VIKPGHPIQRQDIAPEALKIIYRLHRLGFTAYVTGGAVRDLMLGRPAKDFDIVTDARPGQIKKRFANAYIIGRRFRLVHVRFGGGKTIEVATFRKAADPIVKKGQEGEPVPPRPYGTPEEDSFRRDITINALFYDVINDAVIDYVGGIDDLARKTIRVIGNPAERFAEDPARIWRVLRHAARLGFRFEQATENAIPSHVHLLATCPGARLFEELNKDLSYDTRPVLEALRNFGLLRHIFGKAGQDYESDPGVFSRLSSLLEIKDRWRATGIQFSLEELYAILFWPWLEPLVAETQTDLHKVLTDAFRGAGMRVNIPRMLRSSVVEIMAIIAAMNKALQTGRMRWSLLRRPHYAPASRLFFLIFEGRPPSEGESFTDLFRKAFPSQWRPRGRRRRRSSGKRFPTKPQ
jgi:poly(A) polymerase